MKSAFGLLIYPLHRPPSPLPPLLLLRPTSHAAHQNKHEQTSEGIRFNRGKMSMHTIFQVQVHRR